MSKQVMLKKVRLAFPRLAKAEMVRGEGKPKFSAVLLFEPGSDNAKAVEAALLEVAGAQWTKEKAAAAVKSISAAGKCAYRDGSTKSDYDGFEGKVYLSASAPATHPPLLLDGHKNKLPQDTGVIYAGCYVNAKVELWAMDKSKGFGNQLNCQLIGLQFAADGDSFGGASRATDDGFETVEGAHEAADDDFA